MDRGRTAVIPTNQNVLCFSEAGIFVVLFGASLCSPIVAQWVNTELLEIHGLIFATLAAAYIGESMEGHH